MGLFTRRPDPTPEIVASILEACEALGCVCDPDITLDPEPGRALIEHEWWCPLIRAQDVN